MRPLTLALLLALPGSAAAAEPSAAPVRLGLKPEAAAALKASLPSYDARQSAAARPAAPTPGDGAAAEVQPDGVLLLPEYFVTEEKLRQFSEYDLLTTQGKIDLALKKHPGLKLGPFAGLNAGIGLALLAQEEAIVKRKQARELGALSSFSGVSDPKFRQVVLELQLHPRQ